MWCPSIAAPAKIECRQLSRAIVALQPFICGGPSASAQRAALFESSTPCSAESSFLLHGVWLNLSWQDTHSWLLHFQGSFRGLFLDSCEGILLYADSAKLAVRTSLSTAACPCPEAICKAEVPGPKPASENEASS